jgi:hypothetical protein
VPHRDRPDEAEPGGGRDDERGELESQTEMNVPITAATTAATAMRPKASVVVSSSATPSTAATISHTIQDNMAAPRDALGPTVTPPGTVRSTRPV